jgi:hypothetical protein
VVCDEHFDVFDLGSGKWSHFIVVIVICICIFIQFSRKIEMFCNKITGNKTKELRMEDRAYECVIVHTKKYKIDESHALKHSIEVARFAASIYTSEVAKNPHLVAQKNIIIASAILHDMCDRKYVPNELNAICDICDFMKGFLTEDELNIVVSIITTMSYSKVKQKGYPDLGEHQLAYHIVREADLLAAYDIDRCVMYGMLVENLSFTESSERAKVMFNARVMKYRDDGLFITNWSKAKSLELHNRNL